MKPGSAAFIVYALLSWAAPALSGQPAQPGTERLLDPERSAVEWLLAHKAPTDRLDSPVPWRRNLVIGYEIPDSDPAYPYLMGRSYAYDSALASIAFAMTGRYREAEDVLLALARQILPDGSLWFGVNVHNEWPSEQDASGATVRSGASAWAGYAAVFYLRERSLDEPGFAEEDRIGRRILAFAEAVARHLMSLRIEAPGDPRRGLVTGGRGEYELRAAPDGSVESVFVDGEIGWVSAEHNIDAYFLFRDLALLTGDEAYAAAAEATARGLLSLWDAGGRQLIQGVKADGRRDAVLPLDTASWGSMFLRAAGAEDKADAALKTGLRRFRIGRTDHFRPYAEGPVYPDPGISRICLGDPDITWDRMDVVWPEGSLGMAAALVKAGRYGEAFRIIEASLDYAENGGIRYASREVPHQFAVYPSAAATAWFVVAVELLTDPRDRDLFWSRE